MRVEKSFYAATLCTMVLLGSNAAMAQSAVEILRADTGKKTAFGHLESSDQKEARLLMVYATKRIDWKGQITKMDRQIIVFQPMVDGKALPLVEFKKGVGHWECKACADAAGKDQEFFKWTYSGTKVEKQH